MTDVYLVRHGDAVAETVDPARPLSARGRDEIDRVGRLAARLAFRVSEIHHSGLLRARQTAEILAGHLAPARGVREATGLRPEDDPWIVAGECQAAGAAGMFVGHLPHLGRLVAALVIGDPAREIVRFDTGTLAVLTRTDRGFLIRSVIGAAEASTEES